MTYVIMFTSKNSKKYSFLKDMNLTTEIFDFTENIEEAARVSAADLSKFLVLLDKFYDESIFQAVAYPYPPEASIVAMVTQQPLDIWMLMVNKAYLHPDSYTTDNIVLTSSIAEAKLYTKEQVAINEAEEFNASIDAGVVVVKGKLEVTPKT